MKIRTLEKRLAHGTAATVIAAAPAPAHAGDRRVEILLIDASPPGAAGERWQAVKTPYNGSLWGGVALGERLLACGMRGNLVISAYDGRSWSHQAVAEAGSFTAAVALSDEDAEYQKGKLSYFDDEKKQRYIPYVIEPAAGADRATLAFLCDAYAEDSAPDAKGQEEIRVVLRLHPRLAPIKAAVLPLVRKDGQPERARKIYDDLKKRHFVDYDESAAIGKRYRRQDEIGTPLCITVDYDTIKDGTVTVRDRDTMQQTRVGEDKLLQILDEKLHGK